MYDPLRALQCLQARSRLERIRSRRDLRWKELSGNLLLRCESYDLPESLGEVDFGFGFDDEEGVGGRVAGGVEFLEGFVEGVG